MTASWAWRASKQVDPRLRMRLKFLAIALRETSASNELAYAHATSPLGELLVEWPETAGALVWPYQCAAWDAKMRVRRIAEHFEIVEKIPGLKLLPDEKLILADLSHISEGALLVLDRPIWLSREGHLTLSLFKYDFRAFTLSFSLLDWPKFKIFIGGLQGRQGDGVLAMYRDFTKDFNGMRPRDFMLEMVRIFATKTGVERIYAVADDFQIFKHEYFRKHRTPGLNYDEVWQERGGERVAPTHFELPLTGVRRPIEEVSAKKRSLYRRRYEMLDKIEAMWPTDLSEAERKHFNAG